MVIKKASLIFNGDFFEHILILKNNKLLLQAHDTVDLPHGDLISRSTDVVCPLFDLSGKFSHRHTLNKPENNYFGINILKIANVMIGISDKLDISLIRNSSELWMRPRKLVKIKAAVKPASDSPDAFAFKAPFRLNIQKLRQTCFTLAVEGAAVILIGIIKTVDKGTVVYQTADKHFLVHNSAYPYLVFIFRTACPENPSLAVFVQQISQNFRNIAEGDLVMLVGAKIIPLI